MTQLLQHAFAEAAKLPPDDQDALAHRLLDEIASERKWNELFARSQHMLERLADEALAEHYAGQTVYLHNC